MKKLILFSFSAVLFFSLQSHATKCGEFVYNKHGMLKHYEWLPNTASENTKKNGVASSTIRPSTEDTTASSDPGVTTGSFFGATQSFSSYGDCSFWSAIKEAGKQSSYRHIYIQENIDDIKKQAALGEGGAHMDSIAVLSNCPIHAGSRISALMQKNYAKIYDYNSTQSEAFATYIDHLIHTDSELSSECVVGT